MTHAGETRRTAWVTGAAQGIGAAIAKRLANDGCRLVLIDRDEDKLLEQQQALAGDGAQVGIARLDLADEQLGPALATLARDSGLPDILVNNAGIAVDGEAHAYPQAAWRRTFAINVHAPFLLAQLCLPAMRERRWGRIVNIASVSGLRAGTGRLAYGTSKAALIAMTSQIAIESATWGVTANAVAPGAIETELTRKFHAAADRERIVARIPARRYGMAGDIASAVSFLVSDEASYITGHTLAVDGGFSCAGFLLPRAPEHT